MHAQQNVPHAVPEVGQVLQHQQLHQREAWQYKPKVVLQHPFTMMVTGPTGSGKTQWVQELLLRKIIMIEPTPKKILWFYQRWQPLYTSIKALISNVEFIQGLPLNIKRDDHFDKRFPTLMIFDDLMRDATQNSDICDLFTEGSHHRNLSVICILQNMFCKGKENRTMSLNSHYMILFKNPRDQQQVTVLARQMYPRHSRLFIEEYQAATEKAHGYLFVDLKQNTPDDRRLLTDIFQNISMASNKNMIFTNFSQSQSNLQTVNTTPWEIGNTIIQQNNPTQFSSDQEPLERNMAMIPSSCNECGVLFATTRDLHRHIKRICPDAESDDDTLPTKRYREDVEFVEEDDSGFNRFINKVYDKYDDPFIQKVDDLINKGMERTEARRTAGSVLLPRYRKTLIKNYKDFLASIHELKSSPLHHKIMESIAKQMEMGKEFEKVVNIIMKQQKHAFDDLLENAEESSDEDSTDEGETNE